MTERLSLPDTQESAEQKIFEPENPIAFLRECIERAPNLDYPADAERQNMVHTRRELILSCIDRLDIIAKELCRSFIQIYAKNGFCIKGGVRFYIVGGRVDPNIKALSESSDLDCAFTVIEDEDDVVPHPGSTDYKKRAKARGEFMSLCFALIIRKYGLLVTEKLSTGESVEGSLLEPKTYGIPDHLFRKNNLPAVLVASCFSED